MDRAFSPDGYGGLVARGVAPVWYEAAPLALAAGGAFRVSGWQFLVVAGVSPAGEPGVPPGGPTLRPPGIFDVSGFVAQGGRVSGGAGLPVRNLVATNRKQKQ